MDTSQNSLSFCVQSNMEWSEHSLSHARKSLNYEPKKLPCRYGIGCTHIRDAIHLERFTHPPIPVLDQELLRNSYLCSECGFAFSSLVELRDHLLRKTAWSNNSLVGCRISCLLDNKEWHEGLVTQFHKSGKHSVEFRSIGEKRWLPMSKMAFYILERNQEQTAEYKENESDRISVIADQSDSDQWNYIEDISIEFAFAQSVLFKVYGGVVQETGHKTRGHLSLTEQDREVARSTKGSLLYGELLARGVNKALGLRHLDAASRSVLFDLGMGTGKVLIQAFLQFRNLSYLFGIELSVGRYLIAEEAVLKMVNLLGKESFEVEIVAGSSIKVTERLGESSEKEGGCQKRILHMVCGNMFHLRDIDQADIIMLETEIPQDLHGDLCQLLNKMKEGAQTLTYHDLRKVWTLGGLPFKQLEVNRYLTDRFPTSWSVQRGHHFFLWKKVLLIASPQVDGDPTVQFSGAVNDLNSPTYHDQRAPVTSNHPRSNVVSTGCFQNSFLFSFFGFFRRRSTNDRENERVVPLKPSHPQPLTPNISPPVVDNQLLTPNPKPRRQPGAKKRVPAPNSPSSIVGEFPPHTQSLSLSDHNLTSSFRKSNLSSLVQPLTNSTEYLHRQQLSQSPPTLRQQNDLPDHYNHLSHDQSEDSHFDPVIQQIKARLKKN